MCCSTSFVKSRIFYRDLDSNERDVLIFEERDPSSFLDVSRTKDWSFITVNVNSKNSSEVYLIRAEDPTGGLQLVEERTSGVQYFVEHHQGYLYILTNGDLNGQSPTEEYRLVRCPLERLSSNYWQEVACVDHETHIEDMEIFEKYLVLYQRKGGLPLVQVLELPLTFCSVAHVQESMRTLSLPQDICTLKPGANEDFHSSVLRVSISSPNLPEVVLDYDLASGKASVLQQELSSNIEQNPSDVQRVDYTEDARIPWNDLSSKYTCQQHHITGVEGVSVPLTVVHSANLCKNGQNPALLIGYGAYGIPLEVEWCSDRLSLLDRGWVVAFSHVRGGGELGKSWHQAGQLMQKKNSFRDFVASANYLIDNKFAHARKLGALGISAGGLLVAGAVNLHPALFQAVILQVPFLDISNTLLDKDLPLSIHEYDEWGDPDDPDAFAYIQSYSPYDNVQVGAQYPAMLVKAGLLDTRVGHWEAAKWVANVREATMQNRQKLILLKTSMDTGHFSDGGRVGHLRENAYDYAFLISRMSC